MNKQQGFLLSLGAEIADICSRHNIKFFLAHGSLIGAVRHGGIIPWDDDFDVFMPHGEWQKFKAACQDSDNLPPNRMLCCPDIQEPYLHVMPRYVATDTTCIHKNQSLHDDYAGQVIDIFILDPVADDQLAAYQKDLFLYYDMLIYADTTAARVGASVDEYLELCRYRDEHGKLAACKLCEERLASHFDENGEHYAHRWQGSATVFRRKDFSSQIFVPVGPYELPIPAGFNGVMRSSYGDEWPLMPKNANPAKHDAPASLKVPYAQALEYFHPSHDRQEILSMMQARKPQVLARGDTKHLLEDNWAHLRSTLVSLELEERLRGHDAELKNALDRRDGVALNALLGDYVAWQIDRNILGRRFASLFWRYQHPVFIEVEDGVFEALVLALVCTERIGRAAQLLEVRRNLFKLPLTPLMLELDAAIEKFRCATDFVCAGQIEPALPLAQELRAQYPAAVSFWRLELVCLDKLRRQSDQSLLEQEEELLSDACERYKNDGFFMFYQLECRSARGEDVASEYPVAAELTVNGLILSNIQKRFGYAPSWLRNKRWAKANGVPQWEGREPELPQSTAPGTSKIAMCKSQRLCLQLLQELASTCDELVLPYVCSPKLAKALYVNGKVPAHVSDFSLCMKPSDALALARELAARHKENRVLSGMGIDELEPATLFYGACGTTALSLREPLAQQQGCLGVFVHMLLPSDTPEGLFRVVKAYSSTAKRGDFKLNGKKAGAYAMLHGIKGVSLGTASKLAAALAKLSCEGKCSSTVADGKATAVPVIDFASSCAKSFEDIALKVPDDLAAYCAKADVETANSLNADPKFIASASIDSQDLLAAYALPDDFDERIAWYRERGAEDALTMRLFNENYAQLHLAVKLKELSLKLFPKKEKIAKMRAQGDVEGLSKLLKGYKACYRKYRDVGVVSIDPEIDEALKLIL